MRRTILVVLLGVALVAWALPASARGRAEVTFHQEGQGPLESLQCSNYFTVQGSGFKTWSKVYLCFQGIPCMKFMPNSDGSFSKLMNIGVAGTYKVWAKQFKSRRSPEYVTMWQGEITLQ